MWVINGEPCEEVGELPKGWAKTNILFNETEVTAYVISPREPQFPGTISLDNGIYIKHYIAAMQVQYHPDHPETPPSVGDLPMGQLLWSLIMYLKAPYLVLTDSSDPAKRHLVELYLGRF